MVNVKEFLEKILRQNVIMTENKEVYKKLPLAYRGRYDIFTVLLSEGDTTITLLCERVNIYCARVNSIARGAVEFKNSFRWRWLGRFCYGNEKRMTIQYIYKNFWERR